jgi:hypothetical protein
MSMVIVVVGIGILGFFVKWITGQAERSGRSDLGIVSQQWLAEHRSSQTSSRGQS